MLVIYTEVKIGGTCPRRAGEREIWFQETPSQCRIVATNFPGKPTAHPSYGLGCPLGRGEKKTDFKVALV